MSPSPLVQDLILAGVKIAVVALVVGIPLGLIYLLVRFVKWAWMND